MTDPGPRYILAIDSAMNGCSAAVLNCAGGGGAAAALEMERGQAEQLVPLIERVMAEAGINYENIDLIATARGPGTFTGLRLGLSTARALAMTIGVPCLGLTTLDLLAAQYLETQRLEPDQHLCVLVETKRQDFYVQVFNETRIPLREPQALGADEIAKAYGGQPLILYGDAVDRFLAAEAGMIMEIAAAKAVRQIDPSLIARLAHEYYKKGNSAATCPPEPLYLRPPDVTLPGGKHGSK